MHYSKYKTWQCCIHTIKSGRPAVPLGARQLALRLSLLRLLHAGYIFETAVCMSPGAICLVYIAAMIVIMSKLWN